MFRRQTAAVDGLAALMPAADHAATIDPGGTFIAPSLAVADAVVVVDDVFTSAGPPPLVERRVRPLH